MGFFIAEWMTNSCAAIGSQVVSQVLAGGVIALLGTLHFALEAGQEINGRSPPIVETWPGLRVRARGNLVVLDLVQATQAACLYIVVRGLQSHFLFSSSLKADFQPDLISSCKGQLLVAVGHFQYWVSYTPKVSMRSSSGKCCVKISRRPQRSEGRERNAPLRRGKRADVNLLPPAP
jgi:hypothetical protein